MTRNGPIKPIGTATTSSELHQADFAKSYAGEICKSCCDRQNSSMIWRLMLVTTDVL